MTKGRLALTGTKEMVSVTGKLPPFIEPATLRNFAAWEPSQKVKLSTQGLDIPIYHPFYVVLHPFWLYRWKPRPGGDREAATDVHREHPRACQLQHQLTCLSSGRGCERDLHRACIRPCSPEQAGILHCWQNTSSDDVYIVLPCGFRSATLLGF